MRLISVYSVPFVDNFGLCVDESECVCIHIGAYAVCVCAYILLVCHTKLMQRLSNFS